MPDGMLWHLRDTYPIETAWALKWVGATGVKVSATVSNSLTERPGGAGSHTFCRCQWAALPSRRAEPVPGHIHWYE